MAKFIGPLFGLGRDRYFTTSTTGHDVNTRTTFSCSAGNSTVVVGSNTGFYDGSLVLAHKSCGGTTTAAGTYEFNRVVSSDSSHLYLASPMINEYQDISNDQSQIIAVPEYHGLTIPSGTSIVPSSWDGNVGGITCVVVDGVCTIGGSITSNGSAGGAANGAGSTTGGATGGGFRGGHGNISSLGNTAGGWAGDSDSGLRKDAYPSAYGGAGTGARTSSDNTYASGGGAGHASTGTGGSASTGGTNGLGGQTMGSADMSSKIFMGAGGGGGAWVTGDPGSNYAGAGGSGGGIIIIIAKELILTGSIAVNGGGGNQSYACKGGSGAGGSVLIKSLKATIGTNLITATGGTTGASASAGRIRIETNYLSGTTNPTLSSYGALVPWSGHIGSIH